MVPVVVAKLSHAPGNFGLDSLARLEVVAAGAAAAAEAEAAIAPLVEPRETGREEGFDASSAAPVPAGRDKSSLLLHQLLLLCRLEVEFRLESISVLNLLARSRTRPFVGLTDLLSGWEDGPASTVGESASVTAAAVTGALASTTFFNGLDGRLPSRAAFTGLGDLLLARRRVEPPSNDFLVSINIEREVFSACAIAGFSTSVAFAVVARSDSLVV